MRTITLLVFLFLTGCSVNTCISNEPNLPTDQRTYKNTFCLKNFVYNTLKNEDKEDSYIFDVATYQYNNTKKNERTENVTILACRAWQEDWTYFKDMESDEVCLASWKKGEEKYLKDLEENKNEQMLWQKHHDEEEKRLENLEKKSGLKWCAGEDLISIINNSFYLHKDFPKNCLFELGHMAFHVLQQTPEGTLVNLYPQTDFIYFIQKNKKDSQLVDNSFIKKGVFVNIGIYQYTNTFGALKTVYKLKRIE